MQRIERTSKSLIIDDLSPIESRIKPSELLYSGRSDKSSFLKQKQQIPDIEPPESFEKPNTSVFKVIYNFLNRLESIQGVYLEMCDSQMQHTSEMISMHIEKHIKLQDQLEKAIEKQGFWDTLAKVSGCIIGTLSIILGSIMLGPGAPIMAIIAGSSMIASGGISIFGTSLIDSKKHPTAAAALLISGSGIAVVGGALGAINGAFSGVDLFKNVLSKVIVAGLSVVSNGTEIMKQNYDIDLSKLKADSALSQKENESAKERNRSLEMESQSYNETISNLTDTCIALQIHHQSAIRKITALSGAIAG